MPDYVHPVGTNAKITSVELAEIDAEDKTFQFRVSLRVKDLVESIRQNGQQIAVVLRRVEGRDKLQVISGFRRIHAISRIGWVTVNAIVLDGISDDAAWRLSVLENEARKTYTDLDRAYAIVAYRKMGHTVEDIAEQVFHLSRKQVTRLNSLASLPGEVQEAIAEGRIATTHALVLKQLHDRLGRLDYQLWIHRVESDALSVGALRAAVLASRASRRNVQSVLVRTTDKATGREVLRFRPLKIDPSQMTREERAALAAEMETLLEELRS